MGNEPTEHSVGHIHAHAHEHEQPLQSECHNLCAMFAYPQRWQTDAKFDAADR